MSEIKERCVESIESKLFVDILKIVKKFTENDEDYILRFPCNSNTEELLYPDETIEYNKLYKCSHTKSRDVVYTKKNKAR